MRICSICKKEKPDSAFNVYEGKPTYLCRECKRKKSIEDTRKFNEYLESVKDAPRCKRCTIILSREVCRCGIMHGEPSANDPHLCKDCSLKRR